MYSINSSPHENPQPIIPSSLQSTAEKLVTQLEPLTVSKRLSFILRNYGESVIALTSGGIQSLTLPTVIKQLAAASGEDPITKIAQNLPYVFIDTGDLFSETLEYIKQTAARLGLNLFRVAHDLTPQEFSRALEARVLGGESKKVAFDMLTKARVLQSAIEHPELFGRLKIEAIIAGNRRDQSASRATLPLAEAKNGLLYFYPFADWTRADVRSFESTHQLPPHPLERLGFPSVGNRADTVRPPDGARYEKDGRHEPGVTECGLHLWWLNAPRDNFGVRILRDWSEKVRSPRPD